MSRVPNGKRGMGSQYQQPLLNPNAFNIKAGSTASDAWIHIRPPLQDPMQPSSKKVHDSGVTMSSAASSKQSSSSSSSSSKSSSTSSTSGATSEPAIIEEWEVVYPDD